MSDFAQNKIKFAISQPQSITISSWENTEFNGKPGMKYNTSDGRFFDASPGLIKLLQAIPVQIGQTITIEKRPHPEMQYGCFYVDGRNFDEVSSGVAPAVAPAPAVANPVAPAPATGGVADVQSQIASLVERVTKLEASQLF